MTGQMLLGFLGWDGFTTSKDVVACLRDAGLDLSEEARTRGDLRARGCPRGRRPRGIALGIRRPL
ncbi:hypothetical protein DFR50_121117 [Roseiarcus fermentans]|uniref:Uncharacterized protein n=1 Tax=Roseiarcus fermentans TaxID=1473586 RepID=A0A366F546_9HYPH|nr:hypothetical protein DFR50_121117 [Roseiarcus fermentans]